MPPDTIKEPAMKLSKKTWGIIIRIAIAAVIVAVAVTMIVLLTRNGDTSKVSESAVSRGTLFSTISASGIVKEISSTTAIPLAALIYDVDDITELENASYETNWATILLNAEQSPLAWRVDKVEKVIADKKLRVDSDTGKQQLLTLTPVYFDVLKLRQAYEEVHGSGESDETIAGMLLSILFQNGSGSVDPATISDAFLKPDPTATRTVTTAFVDDLMKKSVSPDDSRLEYTLARVTYKEGDYLTPESPLLTASYTQLYVSYTVSEYDYREIAERLRADENVYAAVSVNALKGEKVLAHMQKMVSSTNTSGVSYYTLLARLVFGREKVLPPETEGGNPRKTVDYTYYCDELTDEYIGRIGLPVDKTLSPDDIVNGYSVTVTSQKKAIPNTLIVATKCIFYDDSKNPYVILLDEKGKEKRVYVRIMLSTGTEAAVTPAEGYSLSEGDKIKYLGDSSLISSLF